MPKYITVGIILLAKTCISALAVSIALSRWVFGWMHWIRSVVNPSSRYCHVLQVNFHSLVVFIIELLQIILTQTFSENVVNIKTESFNGGDAEVMQPWCTSFIAYI